MASDPQNLVTKNDLLFCMLARVSPPLAPCGSLQWLVPRRAGEAVQHPHIRWLVPAEGQTARFSSVGLFQQPSPASSAGGLGQDDKR